MKIKILTLVAAASFMFQGCHDPEIIESNGDPKGIQTVRASFLGDETSDNAFDGLIDYDAHTITVRFPMFYPPKSDNLLPEDALKEVRLVASLEHNATIEPALGVWDLTTPHYVTVKNPQGVRTTYTVTGEIRPLWDCEMVEIELADGTTGIVDNTKHVISLLTVEEDLPAQTAKCEVSPHATIVPDITAEEFDFDAEDAKIKVVAQNGVDYTEYTFVKGEPDKVPFGFREGSQKLMWVKRCSEVGYTMGKDMSGLGVTDKYIVLNQPGVMQAPIIRAADGTPTGKFLDMSAIPNGYNYCMTSDDAGHIIVNSMWGKGEQMIRIWVFDDLESQPREIIKANAYNAGPRVSVAGDVTKDAVVVVPLFGTNQQFVRWTIKNGEVVGSPTMPKFAIDGTAWGNIDIAPTDPTNPDADYYAVYYAAIGGNYGHGPVLYDGKTNTLKAKGLPNTKKRDDLDGGVADAGNWVMNSCDYKEFNRNKYLFHNSVNTFTWGENDMMWLLDVTGGNLTTDAIDMGASGLDMQHNYGAMAAGSVGKDGNNNETRLWVSENGFYMYAYFMFADGYIGCIRTDCIKH